MRKDLKIGLAIGAVLLVVLIVYLAVPKSEDQLAQNTDAGANPAATEPGTPHDEATTGSSASATGAGGSTGTPTKPEQASPAHPPTDTSAEKPEHAAGATAKQDPFANSDVAWAKALDEGQLSPSISSTPSLSATGGRSNPDTGSAISMAGPKAKTTDVPAVAPPVTGASTGTDVQPLEPPTAGPAKPTEPKTIDDAAATTAGRPHKIRSGETYSSIAKVVYGDARYYIAIEKANPEVDPAKLKVGTEIKLPDAESVKGAAHPAGDKQKAEASSASASSGKEVDAATEYRVQSGDSLHKIAMKRYGSSTMADKIYEINKTTIGDDSAKLKIGMVLKMPPNPNAGESQISLTR